MLHNSDIVLEFILKSENAEYRIYCFPYIFITILIREAKKKKKRKVMKHIFRFQNI